MPTATVTRTASDAAGHTVTFSNQVTYTDPAPQPMVVMMGCSPDSGGGGTLVWEGWRCYNRSSRDTIANRTGSQRPKFLAYSEQGPNLGGATPNYQTIFNACLADLNGFYYVGGATSQTRSSRWGIKLFWSNGNENHDKGALTLPHTAAGIAAFVTSQRALYDAVHYIDPATGQRRFPDAYAGSDPITEAERDGVLADYLGPSAPYHDFLMWSVYPAGRKDTEADPTFNWPSLNEADRQKAPDGYMVRVFYRTKQTEAAAGHPIMICVGETGTGDDPDDSTTRPYWAVHGFMHSWLTLCEQYDLESPFVCWWDNQLDATSPQNRLADEPATTNPSTRQAWQNHLQYNHLRGGTHPASWAGNPKPGWKTTGTVR